MVPDAIKKLLTAAVDGELSLSQQKRLNAILQDSDEARELYEHLLADSKRVASIPAHRLPVDFAHNVLQSIQDMGLKPRPVQPQTPFWSNLPVWASFASAAAVLLAISVGSYLYFASAEAYKQHHELAERTKHRPIPNELKNDPITVIVKKNDPEPIVAPRELPNAIVQNQPQPIERLPLPSVYDPDRLTSPVQEPLVPRVVEQPRLPLLIDLKTIDQASKRQKLDRELKHNEPIRIELFCNDGNRALERIQHAMKASHRFMIDGIAEERIKKKFPTQFAIYSETMTGVELTELLVSLGAEDRKADSVFDKGVLTAFQSADVTELAQMLGVPSKELFKVKVNGAQRPFTETTPEQIVTNLATRTPGSPLAPATKQAERAVLVMPYQPVKAPPMASTQIRAFVEQRKERKDGALPVLIILRTIAKN